MTKPKWTIGKRHPLPDPEKLPNYPGVQWHARDKYWRVRVKVGEVEYTWPHRIYDQEIAVRLRDVMVRLLHGQHCQPVSDGKPPEGIPHAYVLMRLLRLAAKNDPFTQHRLIELAKGDEPK